MTVDTITAIVIVSIAAILAYAMLGSVNSGGRKKG